MARLQINNVDVDGPTSLAITTTTETVVATLPGVSTAGPDSAVVLEGCANIVAGTAATSITVRVRRGSVTGPVVDSSQAVTVTAGSTYNVSIQVLDHPGEVAGQVYVMTVQQTAATGNGTSSNANLQASY